MGCIFSQKDFSINREIETRPVDLDSIGQTLDNYGGTPWFTRALAHELLPTVSL